MHKFILLLSLVISQVTLGSSDNDYRWGDGIFNGGFKKGFLQKDKQADFVFGNKNTEVKCFDFLSASDLESLNLVA